MNAGFPSTNPLATLLTPSRSASPSQAEADGKDIHLYSSWVGGIAFAARV